MGGRRAKLWTDHNLDLRGKDLVYIGYFGPLNVQGQSEVILCISNFRQDYIVTSAS